MGEGIGARALDALKHWQALVGVVAACVGLWFSWIAEARRASELNLSAMRAAEERIDRFAAEPHTMVAWLDAAYPRHAYCAALTVLEAEQAGPRGRPAMGDAVANEMQKIATRLDLDLDALRERGRAQARDIEATGGRAICGDDLGVSALGRLGVERECQRALAAHMRNACFAEWRLAVARREAAAREAAEAAVVASVAPPPPSAAVVSPPPGDPIASAPSPGSLFPGGRDDLATAPPPEPPLSDPGPDAEPQACADPASRPVVFPHVLRAGDRPRAQLMLDAAAADGWTIQPLDVVENGRSVGDVRVYRDADAACGARLLGFLAGVAGADAARAAFGDGRVISLEGAYRNLPAGRMELWFPRLSDE